MYNIIILRIVVKKMERIEKIGFFSKDKNFKYSNCNTYVLNNVCCMCTTSKITIIFTASVKMKHTYGKQVRFDVKRRN